MRKRRAKSSEIDVSADHRRSPENEPLPVPLDHRRGDAFHHDVDAGRFSAYQSALDSAWQLGGVLDKFPMAAQGCDHLVVATRQQLAAVHALAAIFPELNLALGVPARVVAKHGDEGQAPPHRRFKFGKVEPDRAVAEIANTGASRSRAERAKESEAPIAPATPFTSRRRTGSMPWPHCANSPPSQTRTALAFRSMEGRKVRNTSAGCNRPAFSATTLAHAAGRWSSAARASISQSGWRGLAIAARAMSVSAALRILAMQPSSNRSPFSLAARSTSAASGSIAMRRTPGSNAGSDAQRVVKSSAFPSSTIRSMRRRRSDNAPSVASARPRGLSRITAGALVAASNRFSNARPPGFESCGPAKMIGRSAWAIAARTASATASARTGAVTADLRGSGQTMGVSSPPASRRYDGQLRCTGPGRPDVAMPIALPISSPRVAAALAVQDALVTGAAISAWRISWKPPRPSSHVAAWPESSTIGDSAPRAVNRAPTALAWPGVGRG